MKLKKLLLPLLVISFAGPAYGQAGSQECETVDFNGFHDGAPITSLSLFGGDLSLTVTALRNEPEDLVDATAYDMEQYDRDPNTPLPPPPNNTHDDTQRFILCNDDANGGKGTCDGISMMIPDEVFTKDADDSQGGFITISGFDGEFSIPQYDAADSDLNGGTSSKNIILRVGSSLVEIGRSKGLGNGSVETVLTDGTTFSGQAQFEFEGSGGIDNIEICRTPPPTASLGDRVWEDLNRDGKQNCEDTNGNGIIGDIIVDEDTGEKIADKGPECDEGIADLEVRLLKEDCETETGRTAITNPRGFYLFKNVEPGRFCLAFSLPEDDFCDTKFDGKVFELGAPVFTLKDNAGREFDSDVNPSTGLTDSHGLAAGEDNRNFDAGVYCPAKIGDFMFEDTNKNGLQDDGEPGVAGVKTTLYECGPDMIAGTDDDVKTGEMRVTDGTGMYMYGAERIVNGDLQDYDLPPGKYFVQFDPTTLPPDYEFTTANVGGEENDGVDSDCLPPFGFTECTDLTRSRAINLKRDCGIVPPPPPDCDLALDKTCRVEAPPPQDFDKCDGKLTQFTVKWTGGDIEISGLPNDSGDGTVTKDQEVTFFGPFDSNDVFVNIKGASNGQSKFHMSCSDDDFNDPSDCGKKAGNGKDDNGDFLNLWTLEGFIDKEGRVLDCDGGSDGKFAQNCEFELPSLPSCDNGDKPDTLTWRYDGGTGGEGDCEKSTFLTIVNEDGKPHEDFECGGSVNTLQSLTVVDKDGDIFVDADGNLLDGVKPGSTFTIRRDDSEVLTLIDDDNSQQTLAFHTSCSQPLEAQATAGALTLVGLDGRTAGQDVTYRYEVTNLGDPLTNVMVYDSELGKVGTLPELGMGHSGSIDAMTALFETTTNTAWASGTLSNGDVCGPVSDPNPVTVTVTEPTCNVSIELYKIEDDKVKWKLSNSSGVDATIENVTLSWPGSTELKKVKFDGNDILKDVRLSSPVTISEQEWQKELKDRTLKAGDSGKKIEFEFTDKFPLKDDQPASDFDLKVTFVEGCSVQF